MGQGQTNRTSAMYMVVDGRDKVDAQEVETAKMAGESVETRGIGSANVDRETE
jgi:hypothetical protein